jgi:hypothetical protein
MSAIVMGGGTLSDFDVAHFACQERAKRPEIECCNARRAAVPSETR